MSWNMYDKYMMNINWVIFGIAILILIINPYDNSNAHKAVIICAGCVAINRATNFTFGINISIAITVLFAIAIVVDAPNISTESEKDKEPKTVRAMYFAEHGSIAVIDTFSDEEASILFSVATKYTKPVEFINIVNMAAINHKPKAGYPFCGMEMTIAGLNTYDIKNFLAAALPRYPNLCGVKQALESDTVNIVAAKVPDVLSYSDTLTLIRDLKSAANQCFKAKVSLTALDLKNDITTEQAITLRRIVMECERNALDIEVNKVH